jgi:hypothetical protein
VKMKYTLCASDINKGLAVVPVVSAFVEQYVYHMQKLRMKKRLLRVEKCIYSFCSSLLLINSFYR